MLHVHVRITFFAAPPPAAAMRGRRVEGAVCVAALGFGPRCRPGERHGRQGGVHLFCGATFDSPFSLNNSLIRDAHVYIDVLFWQL